MFGKNQLDPDSRFRNYSDLVIKTCMLAGKIMIENGSEMTRVNDTIKRIARNAGMPNLKTYITITGIMISVNDNSETQITEIDKRAFDLRKITAVNDLSRRFAEHKTTLEQFYQELQHVSDLDTYFPYWMKILSAAILSGSIEVVFRGDYSVFFITCVIGMLGWIIFDYLNRIVKVEFINEFTAAISIGMLAMLARKLGLGSGVDNMIIGGVMPLVPGVQITNAVRDLMSGNFVSGPARAMEAIMGACALGFGVALALKWFG
ncbi:threonine/serine exporter family protein [Fructilactobacillus fructivorans]|uniref:threonine/serine exporter family protein n=1 Tax=Fructilactobacillus fructivorans TaxID=1614 RepID=UPI000704A6E1|nr:threonine/serine exporter family protein [Fructilactobacillus fructivorans]KRN40389.1 hypothetical protein IV51_GL000095 [Fructilactobacillus fructivorans]KRN42732.1 hypothetical protein IV48_GL001138 [Fructilactobacillus fructivorans]